MRGKNLRLGPALVAVTAAAAAARLVGLGQGLDPLEVNSFWYGRMPLSDIFRAADYFPHLYALVHLCGPIFGDSETALRLPFVLAGVLQVPIVFWLGRRLFSERVGLLAAILTAFSPFQVQQSQTARYYVLLILYASLMLASLLEAWGSRDRRRALAWTGFAGAAILNLHTHLFALYPLALSVCSATILGLSGVGRKGSNRRNALCLVVILLVCAACASDTGRRYWMFFGTQLSSGRSLFESTELRIFNRGNIFVQIFAGFSGGGRAAALFAFLAGAGTVLRWRNDRDSLLHIALWLGAPLASLFVVRSYYHFEPWYFAFLAPLWLIWAACGIDAVVDELARAHPRWGRATLVGLTGLAVWLNGGALLDYYSVARSGWKDAIAEINAGCVPGDVVFLQPESGRELVTRYYSLARGCRLFDLSYLSRPDRDATGTLFGRHRRIWLAAQDVPVPIQREEASRVRSLLERAYGRQVEWMHKDIRVVLYERRRGAATAGAFIGLAAAPFPAGYSKGNERLPASEFFIGNLGDAPEVVWSIPRSSGPLVRMIRLEPGGEAASPLQAGHAYVLSGAVQAVGGRSRWQEGDILAWGGDKRFLLRAARGTRAAVLQLSPTDEVPSLVRVRPGETLDSVDRRSLVVVLRGRLKLRTPFHGPEEGGELYFLKGDAFTRRRARWHDSRVSNAGPEDAILLIAGILRPN